MVNGPQRAVAFSADLHEHLVKMPSPLWSGQEPGALLADLGCEQRAESVSPEPHGFVADLDAALVQKILHIAEK